MIGIEQYYHSINRSNSQPYRKKNYWRPATSTDKTEFEDIPTTIKYPDRNDPNSFPLNIGNVVIAVTIGNV